MISPPLLTLLHCIDEATRILTSDSHRSTDFMTVSKEATVCHDDCDRRSASSIAGAITAMSIASVVPGAVQGATTILLGHPLDTLKTRQQAMYRRTAHTAAQSQRLLPLALSMLREEGVLCFYRGVVPPLTIAAVKRSAQLALFEKLTSSGSGNSGSKSSTSLNPFPNFQPPAWAQPFLSGAFAGSTGTIVGCPMNVIKVQTQNTSREVIHNAWSCTLEIYRRDGPLGFYRGWRQQLAKDCLFAGTYLGLYATLKTQLMKRRNASCTTPWEAFLAGSCASMFTWVVLFPLDTLKTRAQARSTSDIARAAKGSGAIGWYRGLGAALLRAGPVNGFAMLVYESTRGYLNNTPSSSKASLRGQQ